MRVLDEIILVSRFSAALDNTPMFFLRDPSFEDRMSGTVTDFAAKHRIEMIDARRILKAARRAQLARRSVLHQMEQAA